MYLPAGNYLSGSIHLRSNITVQFDPGAVILASADPATFDPPEDNPVVPGAILVTGVDNLTIDNVNSPNDDAIVMQTRGGMTMDQVARQPADLVSTFFFRTPGGAVPPRQPFDTPEREKEYPEPSMFGLLPAYGFFIRHAKGIELNNVQVGFMQEDRRPAFVLDDVSGADFQHVKAQKAEGVSTIVLRNVQDFTSRACTPLPDTKIPPVDRREM